MRNARWLLNTCTCRKDYKMLKLLHFCMSVCIGWKQRALVFSMRLSNANLVSTWMGDILTQQCSVECSCIFFFYYYLFYLFIFFLYLFFFPHYFVTHMNDYVFQRNLIFSMKLSNANPVSAWMGERLTLPGAVDFSCILFFFFFLCLLLFSFFCHS